MRILLMADIHIGSIKEIPYVYNTITDIIEKEIIFKKTDLVVILGDYFHRLFKVNEEYVSLAINIISFLVRSCKRSNTKIRIVYGTESHEMNQYKLFNHYITSKSIDIEIIDRVTSENINGCDILYVPEEYVDNKMEYYKEYLYSGKQYKYIFGHGVIIEGMPAAISYSDNDDNKEKKVPRFKSGELSSISDICVFGHYHIFSNICDNVYYLGSLFRDSFGEEEAKGYGIIEDDQFTFVENKNAYIFKTYEFNENSNIYDSSDNIVKEINKIKEENKNVFNGDIQGSIRIIFKTPKDIDKSFRENLKSLLMNDKCIHPLIKEYSEDLSNDLKDEIDDEFSFILDNSIPLVDKLFRYISHVYDNPMSQKELEKYIKF